MTARPPVVDHAAVARRLRRALVVIGTVVLAAWLVAAVRSGGAALADLAGLVGLGLVAAFAVELVVVGGAALRGLLEAGARGDRLSSPDVALTPPQWRRRLARWRAGGPRRDAC